MNNISNSINTTQQPIQELRKLSIQERTHKNTLRTLSNMVVLLNAYEAQYTEIKPNSITTASNGVDNASKDNNIK